MTLIAKALKPTSIFLAIFFLLAPAYVQSVAAAMIGTGRVLAAVRSPDTRGYLRELLSREDIRGELVSHGIDPEEASARVGSLSDQELAMIAEIFPDLPAGGDGTGFAVIVGMVIMLVAILVEYFSEVKMIPQLHSDE